MDGIDPIVPRKEVLKAVPFSEATLWREQRAGRFPPFENISPRLRGVRLSWLKAWHEGRRDWLQSAERQAA